MVLEFPPGWPEGCPPLDADLAEGAVYRIVRYPRCVPQDFLTHAELHTAITAPACMRVGLSVYKAIHDAIQARRRYPWLGSRIARGYLNPLTGLMKSTSRNGDSHMTWWTYATVKRVAVFTVIHEG